MYNIRLFIYVYVYVYIYKLVDSWIEIKGLAINTWMYELHLGKCWAQLSAYISKAISYLYNIYILITPKCFPTE